MSRTRHHVRGRGKRRHRLYGTPKFRYGRGRALRERALRRANPEITSAEVRRMMSSVRRTGHHQVPAQAPDVGDDVDFSLCALNPGSAPSRRRLRRARLRRRIRRSWREPTMQHALIDELALEYVMRRRGKRSNPRKGSGRSWFKKLPKAKQRRLIQLALGRMNPQRKKRRRIDVPKQPMRWRGAGASYAYDRRAYAGMPRTSLNPRDHERLPRTPSERDWRGYTAVKRALKRNPARSKRRNSRRVYKPRHVRDWRYNPRGRRVYKPRHVRDWRRLGRNPKRDGSPTRGEKRKAKYVEYLKKLAEKGQEARSKIQGLTGELPKAEHGIFEPLGKRAVARAVKDHTRDWDAKHSEELRRKHDEADGEDVAAPAAEAKPEHPDLRHIRSNLHDIDVLVKSYQDELRQLGDSEENEAEVEHIHGEIALLAKRKKALRSKMDELTTATNPRRRGRGRIRLTARAIRLSRDLSRTLHAMRVLLRKARTCRCGG